MTFSIAGRCARTGAFGMSISTSSIVVGSRCAFAKAGAGAVLTQHRTDPRLGPRGIELLRSGCSAQETMDALVASSPHIGWRQLAAIDRQGRTAAFAGDRIVSTHNEVHGRDCIASETSSPAPRCRWPWPVASSAIRRRRWPNA